MISNGKDAGELLDQTPPAAIDMEAKLCGCLLLDGRIASQLGVTAADFSDPRHRLIFATAIALAGEGLLDVEVLTHRLKEQEKLDEAGGTGYLGELLNGVAVPQHWSAYQREVQDAADRRRLLNAAIAAIQAAHNRSLPISTALDRLAALGDRTTDSRREIGSISMVELDGDDSQATFLVEGILVEGEPAAIGAARKSLKTSFAWDMAISLATGRPFLGRFRVLEPRRVLYLSGEGSRPFIRSVMQRVCLFKGLTPADLGGLRLGSRFARLDNPSDLAAIRQECEASEATVLFIDPLYLAMSGNDAGNVFSQGERFHAIAEMCESSGITMVLVHHTTRRREHESPGKAPELVDLSWAGLSEFASQWIMVGRREPYDPSSPGSHRMVLEVGGRQGQSGAWAVDVEEGDLEHGRQWDVLVQPMSDARTAEQERTEQARETKHQERVEQDQRKICQVMLKYPEGETAKAIRLTAGLNSARFGEALSRMIENGYVVSCEIPKPRRSRRRTDRVESRSTTSCIGSSRMRRQGRPCVSLPRSRAGTGIRSVGCSARSTSS